jgi:hypothetical protein
MIIKFKKLIFILIFFLVFIISFELIKADDRIPQGVALNNEGKVMYSVVISTQAQAGEFYKGGRPPETELLGHRMRSVLGQRFIGIGYDSSNDLKVELGMEKMLNYVPVINSTTIDAYKILSKHPHTNDTLICSINLTDKDIGDRLTVLVKWYRNSSSWYDNDFDINYSDLSDLVNSNNIPFEEWPNNQEIWNHTMIGNVFYSTYTSHFRMYEPYDLRNNIIGSISPEDTNHYDLWICSVQAFDGVARTRWFNSTPTFIFNHGPDYDDNMKTYYSWKEDTNKEIDLGSYFSDIDNDDIEFYVSSASDNHPGRYSLNDVDININNLIKNVSFTPNNNIVGFLDLIFTGADKNLSYSNDYLRNDDDHTNTSVLTFNILQVNDPPWASDVYISSSLPGYQDTLTCLYTYNDIENNLENTDVVSYQWWKQIGGIGNFILIEDSNSSTLSSDNFQLGDKIICSVKVKDIYYDWPGYSWLKTSYFGKIIGSTYDNDDKEKTYETSTNIIQKNKWHNIVNSIDLNNNVRKIYVDGDLVKESNDVIGNLKDLVNWRLGQRSGSFEGLMDEVAIWNKELNENEIFELYHGNIFGYKYYGDTYTGNEAIIIDLDGDNRFTDNPDQIFVDKTHLFSMNAGDQLFKVKKSDRIFANSINPNDVTCIYYASYIEMNDGNIPEENYYLGSNCASYGGTFIQPSDIWITKEHNWAVNKAMIDSSTSFVYESYHGALTYSNQADIIVTTGNPIPVNGNYLSYLNPDIVFYDSNSNGVYDDGEPIINDTNCNLIFNSGIDITLKGSNPIDSSSLKRFNAGPRAYPLEATLDNNLQAYYEFNNNVEDSKNSNDGNNYNTTSKKGLSCQAREFTKNSFIDLNLEKTNLYTISMWVYFYDLPDFPWQYTPEFLPQMPWLYSGDDVDQSLWSLNYVNSTAVTVQLESTQPDDDDGQIVIGVG